MDTIFALATARGKSGVAVIRISGPDAKSAAAKLCGLPDAPRKAELRTLRHEGEVLDEALVLYFDSPQSFTGEDIVELHLHGAVAVISSVLAALSEIPGCRQAEAGEFTRRALENEKLDLAQVEGLSDLIEAETEAQRKQAMRVLSGALGEKVEEWRSKLIRAAALIEATIDFADEEVPEDVYPEVGNLLDDVRTSLERESAGTKMAERIRDGFEVAIVGPPNVGKSTLLNAFAGREAAITSDVAGTTRDVIEVRMDISGLPITFLDTAGLRETEDKIESLGVELAKRRAELADLRIILLENRGDVPLIEAEDGDMVVVGKADMVRDADFSAVSGDGVGRILEKVGAELSTRAGGAGISIRARHRSSMSDAISSLASANNQLAVSPELTELIAEEIRTAIRSLDSLVGRVDVEDVLDEIFSSFCIGK